ncbi:hypothetical protein [Hymenobacter rigui]|uniref:Uncharacterized protein n=1 Tax=Hymenobacter rigui TaxID=334424 RepID=A0A3R9Q036_9BACT|nr:hypothetical protein [Hymenobacter rigui]RSK50055.1 hypothetical protein EI291_05230 [Hymenobacter rigui]
MQLSTLISQLPRLQAAALAPTVTEHELLLLERSVREALENMATPRLVAATPLQVQKYFYLLEAYAHDLSPQPPAARQRLGQEALRLLQALTPAARA